MTTIHLASLQSTREILVVVLEPLRRRVEAGAEHVVVILNRVLQELARGEVEAVRVEVLVRQSVVIRLVGSEAVDQPDLEAVLLLPVPLLQVEVVVVALRGVDRRGREQCVEAADTPFVQLVALCAFGLLVEVLEDVANDLLQSFRRDQRPLLVDGTDLLVGDLVRQRDRVDVVDPERQHVLVRDRVDDGVRV